MSAPRPTVTALGLLAAAIATAGCGGSEPGGRSAAHRQPGIYVVIPAGSEVTKLTVPDTTVISPTAQGTAAFPLLAYRELCGDLRPDNFGLAPPRLAVATHRGSDGRTVRFGDTTFTGGGIYALVEGASCIDLVTTSSVRTIAQLAGDEVAARFQPPPKPDLAKAETADNEPFDPWVVQTLHAQARASSPARP